MGQKNYCFSKQEKLTGKKKIEGLFKRGSSFYLDAFQVRYLPSEEKDQPHQVLISVPKRLFKRAVDRNLIKRRVREAYRLNRHVLNTANSSALYLGFIYLSKKILTYQEIQTQLIKCLERLDTIKSDSK